MCFIGEEDFQFSPTLVEEGASSSELPLEAIKIMEKVV